MPAKKIWSPKPCSPTTSNAPAIGLPRMLALASMTCRTAKRLSAAQAVLKSRDAALRRFDALGGSAQWTDAKDRWDDQ